MGMCRLYSSDSG